MVAVLRDSIVSERNKKKRIYVITEDSYGCNAIIELIKILYKNNIVDKEIIADCHSVGGKGNIISPKTIRIIKSSRSKQFDITIIFTDSDNEDPTSIEKRIEDMLRRNGEETNKVHSIIFEPHIEILLVPDENNPSEYLRKHERYQKSDLPKRIRNIDLKAVSKLKSFQKKL